jgi:nanoRNase/pAp phosphatase (c-di-AMP/oligoRNAs hydrolase)
MAKLYNTLDVNFTNNFWILVEEAKSILITAHISPDDDAFASILAVYEIIKNNDSQKDVSMSLCGEELSKYNFLRDFNHIKFVADLPEALTENTDLVIFVDGSQIGRFTRNPEIFESKFKGKTICIDHHESPSNNFNLALVDPTQPSCASTIYEVFNAGQIIDKPLAEIFLLGILGDTGNFSYLAPKDSRIFGIAQKLLEVSGVQIQEFQNRYRGISQNAIALIKELVQNTEYHQTEGWPSWQSAYIPRSIVENGIYKDSEITEAKHIYMAFFVTKTDGYSWGVVLTPSLNGDCSVSARSLINSINVRKLFEEIKIGGGHNRASGGKIKSVDGVATDPKNCLEMIQGWISSNKPLFD